MSNVSGRGKLMGRKKTAYFLCPFEKFSKISPFFAERSCYFRSANFVTSQKDIYQEPIYGKYCEVKEGNSLYFIFSNNWTIEENQIEPVDNLYQGKGFCISHTRGGPFLELYFFSKANKHQAIKGFISMPSAYAVGNEQISPPPEILYLFREFVSAIVRFNSTMMNINGKQIYVDKQFVHILEEILYTIPI